MSTIEPSHAIVDTRLLLRQWICGYASTSSIPDYVRVGQRALDRSGRVVNQQFSYRPHQGVAIMDKQTCATKYSLSHSTEILNTACLAADLWTRNITGSAFVEVSWLRCSGVMQRREQNRARSKSILESCPTQFACGRLRFAILSRLRRHACGATQSLLEKNATRR